MRTCVRALRAMCGGKQGGDSFCVESMAKLSCTERRQFPNKHKAFEADVGCCGASSARGAEAFVAHVSRSMGRRANSQMGVVRESRCGRDTRKIPVSVVSHHESHDSHQLYLRQ